MQAEIHCRGACSRTEPSKEQEQSEIIRNLREQAHKAFLQINAMEKVKAMEAQHAAQQQEKNQLEWRAKQEQYKGKIRELENKLKERFPFSKSGPSIIDLGELDDSNFLDEIEYVKDEVRDSGIENLQQLLSENDRCPAFELDERRKIINQLHSAISNETKQISQPISDLISLCNKLSLENCSIKEELKNFYEANQVSKCKIQQAYTLLSKFKQNQSRQRAQINQLRQQNRLLKNMYEDQVKRKELISCTLVSLEQKVQKNETQNIKLHEIIKDQSSRIELLSRDHSVYNENFQMNLSNIKSPQSDSATSTFNKFLQKMGKKEHGKSEKGDHRFSCRAQCESPNPLSMFKKRPFLPFQKNQN